MKLKSVFFLGLSLAVYRSVMCPQVSCSNLAIGVCASRPGLFFLNFSSNACPSGQQCSIVSAYTWLNSDSTNSLFMCQSVAGNNITAVTWVKGYCVQRQSNKDFLGGVMVVRCVQDSDCVLGDGSVNIGSCVCGLMSDGVGICNPDISNSVYTGYWTACGSSNSITSEATYLYWSYFMEVWVYLQTNLTCTSNLYELQRIVTLHDSYANSAWEAVLWGFLALGM